MAETARMRIAINVAISGEHGALATALRRRLPDYDYEVVAPTALADVAICTSGKMLAKPADAITFEELESLYDANYRYPRLFTETHIERMKGRGGLIIHLGSNSARYGKPGAEDYAAFKVALLKYCEIRAATAREHGVRLCVLNFGGIATTSFWDTAGVDSARAHNLMPDFEKALAVDDVVETVLAVMRLPKNVALKDALIVARAYQ